MRSALFAAALLGLVAVAAAAGEYTRTETYEGQKVFRCQVRSREHRRGVARLVDEFGGDLWRDMDGEVDIRVAPKTFNHPTAKGLLSRCTVIIEDVEAYLQEYDAQLIKERANAADYFEAYHTYDEIKAWYQQLAQTYSSFATFIPSIGTTQEGRSLFGFRFTSTRGTNKPRIFFQCQIHAREWISGATCGYIINELLSGYGSQSNITYLLDNLEFVVNPIQNPDGYAYTWSNDRLWRKNRNNNGGAACKGVDLNRNYDDHWAQGGSSASQCSDTYHGPTAGSELETKASVAFFKQYAPIYGAIDWHSYSQLILRPYGWTRSNSPDETQLKALGDGMASAIRSVNGLSYTSQKSIDLYTTTGTASDWFYGDEATTANKGYKAAGFTIELRDTGRYGFELPASQIIPSGEENLAAVIYFATELLKAPLTA